MTNKEYDYIIKQQKEIIKQQKEIIDSLIVKLRLNNTSVITNGNIIDYTIKEDKPFDYIIKVGDE